MSAQKSVTLVVVDLAVVVVVVVVVVVAVVVLGVIVVTVRAVATDCIVFVGVFSLLRTQDNSLTCTSHHQRDDTRSVQHALDDLDQRCIRTIDGFVKSCLIASRTLPKSS